VDEKKGFQPRPDHPKEKKNAMTSIIVGKKKRGAISLLAACKKRKREGTWTKRPVTAFLYGKASRKRGGECCSRGKKNGSPSEKKEKKKTHLFSH